MTRNALTPARDLLIAALRQIQTVARSAVRGLYYRIPEVSAEGAALFRIVFGSAAVYLYARSSVGSESVPPGPQADDTPWLMRVAGDIFIASPHLADLIDPWILIWGGLFVAGAFTRFSFAAFTLGAIASGVVHSLRYGHHPISAFLVALLCLLPSRWGDAWSIDAWLHRRRRSQPAEPREYGYAVWVPGVVLGLALAAAAASKLMVGGVGWILNGTVKYHLLTDLASAPVDWGLRLAVIPIVGIALSFGTVAIESLALPAAVFGGWRVRMLAALAVAAMLLGFWLFQGVYWPWWWALLLSFLPWHRVRGRSEVPSVRLQADRTPGGPGRTVRLRHVQAAFLAAAVGQQMIASARRLEVPPLMSAYDMYSNTYATSQAYPADAGSTGWLVATMTDGSEISCRIDRDEAEMIASLPDSDYMPRAAGVLAGCYRDVGAVRTVVLEQRRPHVDWEAGRYLGEVRVRISGPVTLAGDSSR